MVARYGHEIAEHAFGNVGALVVLFPGPALVVVHLAPQVLRGQMMGFLASDLAGLAARAAAGIEVESVSHDGPPFLFHAYGHDDGTLLVGHELQRAVVLFHLHERARSTTAIRRRRTWGA